MEWIDKALFNDIVAFRRAMHQEPELSGQEAATAEKIGAFLEQQGIPFQNGVAGHGLVADLESPQPGAPRIALRADTDALPVHEETGLPFASRFDGIMHACGHDGHTALLLGAACLLKREASLPLSVRFLFQPAEETAEGAKGMIEAGMLDDVQMIFGGHLDRHYALGTIIATDGPVNASSDTFKITIHGRGGHAARPHETTDAVVVSSLLVMAIQTIVSREVNPSHPSVVTVGKVQAGTASNVIADEAVLEGTIRAQDPEVRAFLHASIHRIASAVGDLHGARVQAEILPGTPALINPAEITGVARAAAAKTVGEGHVHKLETANMGAEDFSYYLEKVPGCYVRIGAIGPGQEPHPAHSSRFDFHEDALAVGAAYYRNLVFTSADHLLSN